MVHVVVNGQYIASADVVLGHVVLALHRQAIISVCSRLLQALNLVAVDIVKHQGRVATRVSE
jgi:hypothetical protein